MEFIINLVLLIIIGFIIGGNLENRGKAIGFRSTTLVMLGAYAFTNTAVNSLGVVDYHVIAQIISGIGFVGAGLIFKENGVHNLTTAITVWVVASIGVLLGLNMIKEAIIISCVIFGVLSYKKSK